MGTGQGSSTEDLDDETIEFISGLLTDEMLHLAGRVDWSKARMVLA